MSPVSLCPPLFLYNSRTPCGGGEFEATLSDSSLAGTSTEVALDTFDLENGEYVFHVPQWVALRSLKFASPVLRVTVVFSHGEGMRPPPVKVSSFLTTTQLSLDLRPFECSAESSFSSYISPLLASARVTASAYEQLPRKRVYFVGDNLIFSLLPTMPRRFDIKLFHRLGIPLREDDVQEVLNIMQEDKSDSSNAFVVLSNALSDVVSKQARLNNS